MTTVWWPQLCGSGNSSYNKTDESWAFWSSNITLDLHNPDLTRCFQNSVLVWISCGYLWICGIFWIPYLLHLKTVNSFRQLSRLNITKMVIGIVLCVIYLADLVKTIMDRQRGVEMSSNDVLVKYTLLFCTMVFSVFVNHVEFRKGIVSGGVLFFFWLLTIFLNIVTFRSNILHITYNQGVPVIPNPFHFVTFYITYGLMVVQFILTLFADLSALPSKKQGDEKLLEYEEQTPLSNSGMKEGLEQNNKPCPEETASFLSRISFFWITGMIVTAYRRILTFSDLWDLRYKDRSCALLPEFEKQWKKEAQKASADISHSITQPAMSSSHVLVLDPSEKKLMENGRAMNSNKEEERPDQLGSEKVSIASAIFRTYGFSYAITGLFKLFYDLIGFLHPIILNLLINFIGGKNPIVWLGYLYVAALFIVSMIRTVILQQYWYGCFVIGQQLRTAMIGIIYRKSLKLSSSARKTTTVGEIVNLMAVDAQKLNDAPAYMHMIWSTPLTIALAIYMLWQIVGPSVLAGLGCMLLLVPVNGYVASRTKALQTTQMRHKDTRIRMMDEIFNGIKVLKLYCWERFFKGNVLNVREKELQVLKTAQYLGAASAVSWFMAPYLVALGTFAVFVLSSPDNILDANKAFVSLSLFNILNYPLSILPAVISFGVQSAVSVRRIKRFLLSEEVDDRNVERDPDMINAVEIKAGTFSWGKDEKPVIKNINLEIPEGKLVAVVGQVGSGKSSIISAICGEMEVIQGSVKMKGSVAYVPQQAWIQNATLKDNILFMKELRESKYQSVLDACALGPDLSVLPGGDKTEVGEKGINLSGGQKQRISLARAVYQNSDIYLLDDPLSAVDSHVGKHIFEEVIGPTGLLKNKTRVLVTNSVTYLPKVDVIVVLRNGEITEMGSYDQLVSHNGPFAEFVLTYLQQKTEESDDEEEGENLKLIARQISAISVSENDSVLSDMKKSPLRKRLTSRQGSVMSSDMSISKKPGSPVKTNEKERLTEEESQMTGNVKLSVFVNYVKACRVWSVVLTFVLYGFYLAAQIGTNIWLSIWSSDPPPPINVTHDNQLRDLRLGVYGGLGIAQAIGVFGMSFATATACVNSSRLLHSNLLDSILRAPMSFFDTTPLGRIVNRFSRDVDTIDVNIPMTARIWLGTFSGVFTTIFVISYSTPIFLAAVIPLGIFYYFVQRFYICTSRQLRRIDSVFRSPIYVHFSETVTGASSIRAYRQQDRFIGKSDSLVDRNQMTNYPMVISNRWLGMWLELIGNLIVLFAGLFAVIQRDSISAGLVGLSVSYSLQVTGALNMFVRMTSDIETQIVSVERIAEYVDCPKEAAAIVPENRPPANWPTAGHVEFKDLSVRYRSNLDLVLRNVSCEFKAGEKVGIVGRTGAGKSSLTLSLFRIIEAATGSISVDGIDISSIGLEDLRSKLTVIPQDPVLFSGSLRMNLDPSNSKTDGEIWLALQHAHLESFVSSLDEGLQYQCSEGGENLSVGQRQLVCLARALLRKTKVLVLDEATAAVDLETDDLIQKTIRTEFNECTVITIAHRLNTILDYNRVLVLDASRIAEFDSPNDLLQKSDSIFYSMAKNAGLVQ